jgi:hypothetical protein
MHDHCYNLIAIEERQLFSFRFSHQRFSFVSLFVYSPALCSVLHAHFVRLATELSTLMRKIGPKACFSFGKHVPFRFETIGQPVS